jgi:hypothetical protein
VGRQSRHQELSRGGRSSGFDFTAVHFFCFSASARGEWRVTFEGAAYGRSGLALQLIVNQRLSERRHLSVLKMLEMMGVWGMVL